jgi:hypothetical protein
MGIDTGIEVFLSNTIKGRFIISFENKFVMNINTRILASLLIISGIMMTLKPWLFSQAPKHGSGYAMIEKRVLWGLLIGSGIFLIHFQQWGRWELTAWAILSSLAFGIIIARMLGMVLDGFLYWSTGSKS